MTFTNALILFAIVYTLLFFILYTIKEKRTDQDERRPLSRLQRALPATSFTISAITLLLTVWSDFRESPPYYALMIASIALVLASLSLGVRSKWVLPSVILWHFALYLDTAPAVDIGGGEGVEMLRQLATEPHWEFQWAHNWNYNPLPTAAFIVAEMSRIMGVEWYRWTLQWGFYAAWAVAYDIGIAMLTYALTKDWRASALSVILIAVTPMTPIDQDPYQWSSNMLTILALALIVKYLKRDTYWQNVAVAVLLFSGAILAHPTALSLPIVLFATLITSLLGRTILSRLIEVRWKITLIELFYLSILTISYIAIFILIGIFTRGYSSNAFGVISGVINGVYNLVEKIFQHGASATQATRGLSYVPLYEREGVSPLDAGIWALALALATAYILHRLLIKRKIDAIDLAIYATAFLALGLTFIGYGLLHLPQFYPLNRTSYVFVPYIVPLAAYVLARAISIGRLNKITIIASIIAIAVMLLSATTAISDPNISPREYALIHGWPLVRTSVSDYIKANIIYKYLSINSITIASVKNYLAKIVYTSAGFKTAYIVTNNLAGALSNIAFIYNTPLYINVIDFNRTLIISNNIILNFKDQVVVTAAP